MKRRIEGRDLRNVSSAGKIEDRIGKWSYFHFVLNFFSNSHLSTSPSVSLVKLALEVSNHSAVLHCHFLISNSSRSVYMTRPIKSYITALNSVSFHEGAAVLGVTCLSVDLLKDSITRLFRFLLQKYIEKRFYRQCQR